MLNAALKSRLLRHRAVARRLMGRGQAASVGPRFIAGVPLPAVGWPEREQALSAPEASRAPVVAPGAASGDHAGSSLRVMPAAGAEHARLSPAPTPAGEVTPPAPGSLAPPPTSARARRPDHRPTFDELRDTLLELRTLRAAGPSPVPPPPPAAPAPQPPVRPRAALGRRVEHLPGFNPAPRADPAAPEGAAAPVTLPTAAPVATISSAPQVEGSAAQPIASPESDATVAQVAAAPEAAAPVAPQIASPTSEAEPPPAAVPQAAASAAQPITPPERADAPEPRPPAPPRQLSAGPHPDGDREAAAGVGHAASGLGAPQPAVARPSGSSDPQQAPASPAALSPAPQREAERATSPSHLAAPPAEAGDAAAATSGERHQPVPAADPRSEGLSPAEEARDDLATQPPEGLQTTNGGPASAAALPAEPRPGATPRGGDRPEPRALAQPTREPSAMLALPAAEGASAPAPDRGEEDLPGPPADHRPDHGRPGAFMQPPPQAPAGGEAPPAAPLPARTAPAPMTDAPSRQAAPAPPTVEPALGQDAPEGDHQEEPVAEAPGAASVRPAAATPPALVPWPAGSTPAPDPQPARPEPAAHQPGAALTPPAHEAASRSAEPPIDAPLRQPGARVPLREGTRRLLRPLVGVDPADVPVSAGPAAAQAAEARQAAALATGAGILLGAGRGEDTPAGLGLLAHELYHYRRQPARFVPAVGDGQSIAQEERQAGAVEQAATTLATALARPAPTASGAPVAAPPAAPHRLSPGAARPQPPAEPPPPGGPPLPASPPTRGDWGGLPAPWEPLFGTTQTPLPAAQPSAGAAHSGLASPAPTPPATVLRADLQRSIAAPPSAPDAGEALDFADPQSPAPDIDALAQQVYARLRRRLDAERRRGVS